MTYQQYSVSTRYSYLTTPNTLSSSTNSVSSHDFLKSLASPSRSHLPTSMNYNNYNQQQQYSSSMDPFTNGSTNSLSYPTHTQPTILSLPSSSSSMNDSNKSVPSFHIEPVDSDGLKPLLPPSSTSSLPLPSSSSTAACTTSKSNRFLHSPLEYAPTVSKIHYNLPYGTTTPSHDQKSSFDTSSPHYQYSEQQQFQQYPQQYQPQQRQVLPLPQLYYPQSTSRSSSLSDAHFNQTDQSSLPLTHEPLDFNEDAVSEAIKAAETSAAQTVGRKKRKTRKTCVLTRKEAEVAKIETFECSHCSKIFSRLYSFKSHLKTHSDEKPFNCSYCDRKFARNHDRKRHELLHQGEKKFQCGGVLSDKVTKWGCGKKFARADGLGRHFRTETGWLCIRPLMIEAKELERRQQHQSQNQQLGSNQVDGPNHELSSNEEIINKIIGRAE